MRLRACLFATIVASIAQPMLADAQTIYRCGNEYSVVSCAGGTALANDDRRSAQEHAEGLRLVAQGKRQADDMEQERLRREVAEPPKLAASLGPSGPATTEPRKKTHSPKKRRSHMAHPATAADDFIASVPESAAGKRRPPTR